MAARIYQYAEPRKIYRFRGFGVGTSFDPAKVEQEANALMTGYVWCAPYSEMNDPMEGLYYAGPYVRGQERWEEARQAIRAGKSTVGICAFTESVTNELMWAHYASNFGGIAVEYDFRMLRQHLQNDSAFSRMVYSDALPEVVDLDVGIEKNIRAVLSTKNYRWSYEREWRLFTRHPGPARYDPATDAVLAVYLGPRINPAAEQQLRTVADSLGFLVQKLRVRGYGLEFEP